MLTLDKLGAIGVFGGCGAVGNGKLIFLAIAHLLVLMSRCPQVLGLIIGAIFVQFTSWSWVFWFVAIVAIPVGLVCFLLVPNPHRAIDEQPREGRWKSLDLIGVSILTGKSANNVSRKITAHPSI